MEWLLAQVANGGATKGMTLIERAKAGGWYPLLVVAGVAALIGVFFLLVRLRRDG